MQFGFPVDQRGGELYGRYRRPAGSGKSISGCAGSGSAGANLLFDELKARTGEATGGRRFCLQAAEDGYIVDDVTAPLAEDRPQLTFGETSSMNIALNNAGEQQKSPT